MKKPNYDLMLELLESYKDLVKRSYDANEISDEEFGAMLSDIYKQEQQILMQQTLSKRLN